MFIGFAGMDEGTVNLLTQGKTHMDLKVVACWKYAMYIANDAQMYSKQTWTLSFSLLSLTHNLEQSTLPVG